MGRGAQFVVAGLAALATACAGGSVQRPASAVPSGGGFAGLTLGDRVSLGPPRFEPYRERDDQFVLAGETASVGGVPMDEVRFYIDDGRLESVRLLASSDDEEQMERLRRVGRQVCEGLDADLESFSPSPLGTPEPGEEWDPVYTDNEECSGVQGGVEVSVSIQHNHASDFSRVDLTIGLRAP